VKSLVSSAVKPLLRTKLTALVTTELDAGSVGGVVGGVVAGGPMGTVVAIAVVAVDVGALALDDGAALGRDIELEGAVGAVVVGTAALEEPLELHAHMTSTAAKTPMTCARVRLEANTFIRADAIDCTFAERVWATTAGSAASAATREPARFRRGLRNDRSARPRGRRTRRCR
jgi:hypothetical protein